MSGWDSSRQDDSNGNELIEMTRQRLRDEEAQNDAQRESSNEAVVQQQHYNETYDISNYISPDESARLWNDLEAETGFRSYLDYLRANEHKYPDLRKLKRKVLYMSDESLRYSSGDRGCAIYDVHAENREDPRSRFQCRSGPANVILSVLRTPAAAAMVRVVLWQALYSGEELLNALGLGLEIQPSFFQALFARSTDPIISKNVREPPFSSELFVIDDFVVAIFRQSLTANPGSITYILIARGSERRWSPGERYPSIIPFRKQGFGKSDTEPDYGILGWMSKYVALLRFTIEEATESRLGVRDLTFRSLIPLLQFNLSRIHEDCDAIRKAYLTLTKTLRPNDEHAIEDLFRMRSSLRRLIEDSEVNFERLQGIVRKGMASNAQHNSPLIEVEDDFRQACLEARRWETEIRDYLQLFTGESALQESKKSIELANSQIEEAKRVKIFTILAFIYVPLNLATSIFGMNIQQLNGNGQHLWIFIVTALVALAITGGSWFVIVQVNSYWAWRKRAAKKKYDGRTNFSLAVRLVLIVFLVTHGCRHWMLSSGAWWRILINHKSRRIDLYDKGGASLTAGEYVSKYSHAYWRKQFAVRPFSRAWGNWMNPAEENE